MMRPEADLHHQCQISVMSGMPDNRLRSQGVSSERQCLLWDLGLQPQMMEIKLKYFRSSGYGAYGSSLNNDRSVSRDQSYNARRETDSRGRRSFQLLPSVDT